MGDIAQTLLRALDSGLADRARELLATRKQGVVGTQREVNAIYALRHAASWIGSAPHSDNCFVSNHYEGDPGNRCNCGKDSAEQAVQDALTGYPEAMDADGEPLEVTAGVTLPRGGEHG